MRVLIADDDPVLRHALLRQLTKWNFEPVPCSDGLEVRAMVGGDSMPPLVLIDWNMPGVDGVTLCREIRALPEPSTVYVILLTSKGSREDIVSGLTGGADDYIVKPFDWEELRARVNIGARTVGLQQHLRELSIVDHLTGLYNRRGFVTLAERHLMLARRKRQPLVMLAADLDDLKFINDNYGHAAGDQALRAAAGVLQNTYRSADIVARLSGDEFAVFPLEASAESCGLLRDRLKANLDAYNAAHPSEWAVSMSIGMARLDPSLCTTVEQLLAEADHELYQQKRLRPTRQADRIAGLEK
jgi:two-component system cell cycle response regulator